MVPFSICLGGKVEEEGATRELITVKGYRASVSLSQSIVVVRSGYLKRVRVNEVKVGEYVAIHRGSLNFGNLVDLTYAANIIKKFDLCKKIYTVPKLPVKMTPDLAEFIGMVISEAHLEPIKSSIIFTQKDPIILERYRYLLKNLFNLDSSIKISKNRIDSVQKSNVILRAFLEALGLEWKLSRDKYLPHAIINAPKNCLVSCLSSIIGLEGHVRRKTPNNARFEVILASERLIIEIQNNLINLGIVSCLSLKRSCATNGLKVMRDYWRLRIDGSLNIVTLRDTVGLYEKRKQDLLSGLRVKHTTAREWIPEAQSLLATIIEEFKISGVTFTHELSKSEWRTIRTVRTGRKGQRRELTYNHVSKLVKIIKKFKIETKACRNLIELSENAYYFDKLSTCIDVS